jgi:vacuolar-type H+-ATPase subunit H
VLGAAGSHLADALHTAQKQARPLVKEATSAATKAIDQAMDAGKHAAESMLPEMHDRADSISGKVQSQGQSAVSTMSSLGATATGKLAHTSEAIEQKSKTAATAAGRGTKETGALVAWTAAAAGLAFVAFLNDRQRQQVKESGRRIAAEIKEVYREFQGQDKNFK